MNADDDDKSPLDRTLDVFVYLPVGFLLDLPQSIPRYIERGRRQLDPARLLGRPSDGGRSGMTPSRHIERLQQQTRSTLRGLGVGTGSDGGPNGDRPHAAAPTPAAAAAGAPPEPAPAPTATPAPPAPEPGPELDPSSLAITDYDSLSASQVVPRLDSLSPEELDSIREYEAATRGRKTILSKIALLQSS